jgi:hypothetical protein
VKDVEAAIKETMERARPLLFDKKGKRLTEDFYVMFFMAKSILRPATIEETMHPKLGHTLFDCVGTTYVYDAGLAVLLLEDADSTPFYDRVLCKAAAIMLDSTGRIDDPRLKTYAASRLVTGLPAKEKPRRGRSTKDTWGRDVVIVGGLIPQLLDRFSATRNREPKTKLTESACSIVKTALARLGIHMSERRVEGIWERRPYVRT